MYIYIIWNVMCVHVRNTYQPPITHILCKRNKIAKKKLSLTPLLPYVTSLLHNTNVWRDFRKLYSFVLGSFSCYVYWASSPRNTLHIYKRIIDFLLFILFIKRYCFCYGNFAYIERKRNFCYGHCLHYELCWCTFCFPFS